MVLRMAGSALPIGMMRIRFMDGSIVLRTFSQELSDVLIIIIIITQPI